ncbi:pyrroloquinoline quinone biosynthesis protein PqqE [Saccharopolyspora pogona]|uniref:pyrroloquinoline quinone biosynthesis protein PqqE n=1 Tax=Saccharopolyspora pogona TaxID=333966 RepID=UPI00168818E5|nr:pyrroloquinoline quinone biosynthesis protein PqqE [Saccharopolyspora pogona]
MDVTADSRPGLRRGVRFVHDRVRARHALLYPEGVLLLNDTAADIVSRCDTKRTVTDIVSELAAAYQGVTAESVLEMLADLARRRMLGAEPAEVAESGPQQEDPRSGLPLGLLAELTYRCPLQCTYCSNPLNLADYQDELDTEDWLRVIEQARSIGVLQLHLSGGEPALRRDLVPLVAAARGLGMYTNLVTSGFSLPPKRLHELAEAGLDHIQLSVQDSAAMPADAIAGRRAHARKMIVARSIAETGLPMTVNAVLHRGNIARLLDIVELAADFGAERVELANTQFYGWALRNRAALMPRREQVQRADADATLARERYGDRLEIVYVTADYFSPRPKPCNYGWGNRQLTVAPNGDVLPCLAAGQLPGLDAPSVRDSTLEAVWFDSAAFNRFRGTEWMPDPCRSCALKDVDFGGCRCQAYQLVGDAAVTDPACSLSEHHDLIRTEFQPQPAVPRRI